VEKVDGRTARKLRSHAKILDAAARLLRERGQEGVSVDELMAAAGLTRGGFYAHFRGKTALVASALDYAFAQQRARLFGDDPNLHGRELLTRALHRYLSREHLETPGLGCPAPALATDMARSDPAVRAVFERNMKRVVGIFHERGEMPLETAMVVCALAVGAVTLARGMEDERFADALLAAARHHLAALDGPARAPRARPSKRPAPKKTAKRRTAKR